jgi:uncharacterized 2Fe-2S/4Fe-4S cluster protein (DUF4445 family)
VIGDGPPEGICGSGLVDLLSELLRTGRMNALGRFEDGRAGHAGRRRDIHFLERDVNELAQAKGANIAGLQVVFSDYGIQFDDVAVFYLAGGFWTPSEEVGVEAHRAHPNLADEKIVQVGNAALEGATIALVSRSRRQELEALVNTVEHCRLETHPGFFDFFVDGCQFRPAESPIRGERVIEISDASPRVTVQPAEYTRLLGYPRG